MNIQFSGFKEEDFNVFTIDGLENRMEALQTIVQPKFHTLGEHFASVLSGQTGDEMFYHVAKHARRTTNPPNDSWVAIAGNKRGYKMVPHFQIGLWETHVFAWFAIIYEASMKQQFGVELMKNVDNIYKKIPKDFVWSKDHMKPEVLKQGDLSKEELLTLFERLATVKKAEILCGIHIPKEEAITLSGEETIKRFEETFKTVQPLFDLSKAAV